MRRRLHLLRSVALGGAIIALLFGAWVVWRNLPAGLPARPAPAVPADAALLARGAYLARAGHCMGCHTDQDGVPYAGGRGVATPFGTVYAPNLTPDADTGLGAWSADDFWRALHEGRSRDGRLLYPAFPYPSYTRITRDDADAMHAYLRSLPPVRRARRPHALRFPYHLQASLAVWRALHFSPRRFEPEPTQAPAWNRGRYLVEALGHCMACHAGRNALGGIDAAGGSTMPDGRWYAPSLHSPHEAGVADWRRDDVVALLRDGVAHGASVSGPMADVVHGSTQHLDDGDLAAMAVYLQALPQTGAAPPTAARADAGVIDHGRRLYDRHCADCHGRDGEGVAGIYAPLAGNRAVTLPAAHNVTQTILRGGFAPTTRGNPRPYGMPPFGHLLDDGDVAAVATYIRQSWGNLAPAVSALEVQRAR